MNREKERNERRPEKPVQIVSQEIPEESNELKPGDKVRITGQNTRLATSSKLTKKMRLLFLDN
jgi:hypothetical protein